MGKSRQGYPVDGMLLLDKPGGLSSNQALQRAKKLLCARKAGHTGSLDPVATGLLLLCFGETTKISSLFLTADKSYRVGIRLGVATDTGDSTGVVTAEAPVEASASRLPEVLDAYRGEFLQTPPMFSALKKDGQPLYKLARRGITVEREARQVTVYSLEQEDFDGSLLTLSVRCSRGFYIRSLAEDIGRDLGCGGHVEFLRRTGVGAFSIDRAVTLQQLESIPSPRDREALLLSTDRGLAHLPELSLPESLARYLRLGRSVRAADGLGPGMVRLYVDTGVFLGLGEVTQDQRVQPKRLFSRC